MARHTPPLNARDTTLSDLEPLELVHGHMPKWLLGADPQIITALDASMAHSRFYHGLVGKKFGELQSVEAYCGALLAVAVMGEFGPSLNIHNDYLAVVHVHDLRLAAESWRRVGTARTCGSPRSDAGAASPSTPAGGGAPASANGCTGCHPSGWICPLTIGGARVPS